MLGSTRAPLCLPEDLWRVALPGGCAREGDDAAAAAAGRPTPAQLWGAAGAALDAPARERLAQLLHATRQARLVS